MICPKCEVKTKVTDSRYFADDDVTIRRHDCPKCCRTWFTKEEKIDTTEGYTFMKIYYKSYRDARKINIALNES